LIEQMKLVGSKLDVHHRLLLFKGQGKRLLVRFKIGHKPRFYWEDRDSKSNLRFRLVLEHYKASSKDAITDTQARSMLLQAKATLTINAK
tara:strand:+ start:1320 stop:1589 length:270 start_codon:yes stop_codon:yes gene_type:complete